MKTQIGGGDILHITAPTGGTTSGLLVLIGALLAVAQTTNIAGDTVAVLAEGEFDHTAEGAASGQAWAPGDLVYWDDTNKRLTKTSTSNTCAGYATQPKTSLATTGRFNLIQRA